MTGEQVWKLRKARWYQDREGANQNQARLNAFVERLKELGVLPNSRVNSAHDLSRVGN